MKKLKRIFTTFLIVVFTMTLLPATVSAATLETGSSGTQVKYLQLNLNGLGYGTLDVDGDFGSATKSSVKKFQKAYKLEVDGIAGSETLGKLDTIVKSIQKKLKNLGYDPGSTDGIYGDSTKAAVKKFQSDKGLKATGIAKSETIKKLNNATVVKKLNGTYILTTALKKGMVLDVSGNNKNNRTNIQIYEANGTSAQVFTITHVKDGWHKIISKSSSKAVDVADGKKGSGVNVQLYDYNGTDAQMWKFIKSSDGTYYIQNKLGYYLDVYNAETKNGTNVWVYEANKSKAQKWVLNKATKKESTTKSSDKEKILDINWNHIKKTGKQSASGPCMCFALAYARDILDNKAHTWNEYEVDHDTTQGRHNSGANAYANFKGKFVKNKTTAFKEIYSKVKNGEPVVMNVTAGRSSGEHFVCIVGYTGVTDTSKLNEKNFLMIDPAGGPNNKPENLGSVGYKMKKNVAATDGDDGYYYSSLI